MGSGRLVAVSANAVVVALFAVAIFPNLVNKLVVGGGRQQAANAAVELTPLANLTQYAAAFALVVSASLLIIASASRLVDRKGLAPLFFGLLLWAYMLVITALRGQDVPILALVFPLVLLAFWSARPDLAVLRTVGICGAFVAVLALALGLLLPSVGLYANDLGQLALSDKGLIAGNLLSGPFTSTNNLGQCVVLSVPFILLFERRLLRFAALLLACACIIWSGSRSSLFAVSVGLLFWLLLGRRSSRVRSASAIAVALGVVVLALPFIAREYPDSFSGRGNLWLVSIRAWLEDGPLFGLGDKWYTELAGRRTGLGDRAEFIAFHAHNQFLHIIVVGGLFGLALFVAWLWASLRVLPRLPDAYQVASYLWLLVFLASGALELNLDPLDRVQFFGPALVPVLLLGAHSSSSGESMMEAQHGVRSTKATPEGNGSLRPQYRSWRTEA